MSADNWTHCPKCKEKQQASDPVAEAQKLYGKVDLEAFESAMEIARNTKATETAEETLREDYEFWLEGFCLHISYGCRCEKCGFEFSFQKQVDTKESEAPDEG